MKRSRTYRDAEIHGKRAESIAALTLRFKGYRILARHWKSVAGELDIVARRGRVVAIVEVKARDRHNAAAESLGLNQRRRIGRAATQFIAAHPHLAGCDIRFDVMLVVPWRLPIHLPNAWLDGA